MARITSKSQVDKLGERLRNTESIASDDLEFLQAICLEYDPALREAHRVLQQLGLDPTGRLKTHNTIIEKLKRESTRLSEIQDLAGLRVVKEMSLTEQDILRESVLRVWPEAKVRDRRIKPSHGYRAVHIVLNIDDYPVELQIRTGLQHMWAEVFEKTADEWGRQVRYGHPPNEPAKSAIFGTRAEIVEFLHSCSTGISLIESDLPEYQNHLRALRNTQKQKSDLSGQLYRRALTEKALEMRKFKEWNTNLIELEKTLRSVLPLLSPKMGEE